MKINKAIFGFLVFFLLLPSFAVAIPEQVLEQGSKVGRPWSFEGIVVNDAKGNSLQRNPKTISDGEGGYLVVWEDARSGYFDIYIQKIDKEGNLRFGKDGIAVCAAPKNQLYPNVISDGQGGAIVTWQDYREGVFDIYVQKIDGNGEARWGRGGIPICLASGNQFAPEIIADGVGGAIIGWYDYRSSRDEDIYVQRINGEGKTLWVKDGVEIVAEAGTQWYPKLVSDGKEGAFITWADSRKGEYDIYAQHLNGKGEGMWNKGGIVVCNAWGNQLQPVIDAYGDLGVVIAWEDLRTSIPQVYTQFIDFSGGIFWHKDAVPASLSNFPQKNPCISVSNGQVVVAWEDYRQGISKINFQGFDEKGQLLWGAGSNSVFDNAATQISPAVAHLANGEFILAWQNKAAPDGKQGKNNWQLCVDWFTKEGKRVWEKSKAVALAEEDQETFSVAVGEDKERFLVAWQGKKGKSYDIYGQEIGRQGISAWDKEGLLVNASEGNVAQQNARIINDGFDNYIICWEDARSGYYDIYVQKLSSDGQVLWGKEGIPLTSLPCSSHNPKIVADESGGGYVAWEDFRCELPNIYAQHINASGEALWEENGLRLSCVDSQQQNIDIALSSDKELIVTWVETNAKNGVTDIMLQKVGSDAKLKWGLEGVVVTAAGGDQDTPKLASDDSGGAILAWVDYRNGRRNPDIFAQRIGEKGNTLWSRDGVSVCRAPGAQIDPVVVSDGKGGVVVAWSDAGEGNYDIYAQRLDGWGKSLWEVDGISLVGAPGTQREPRLTRSSDNNFILVWEDYRFDNWDIFAQKLDEFGTSLWGKDGKPICQWIDTQYAPNLVSDGSGGIIVTWEDYRNGRNYTIYSQRVGSSGLAKWEEGGVLVSKTPNGERNPQIAGDKEGNAVIITWDDFRYGGRGIYAQKIVTLQNEVN
ncbi:MAG: hypothetical protein NT099_03865 [Candidatus Saganbacteria bacterium]|nr:hypothetical protein [Candidatus Saganbacteria bacterium]